MQNKYKDCIVAFIDILGFENIINEHTEDTLPPVIHAINYFILKTDESRWNKNVSEHYGEEQDLPIISTFSDCIAISIPSNINENMKINFFGDVLILLNNIAWLGYLTRGCICSGKLYHDDKIIIGPALIKAVRREEKNAIFPRVIIDNSAMEIFSTIDQILEFIKVDNDGLAYVDFFKFCPDETINKLEKMAKLNINHENKNIAQKYQWLLEKLEMLNRNNAVPGLKKVRSANYI